MKAFFKRKTLIILTILVAVAAGSYFIFKKPATPPETMAAKRGEIVQEVSVTGNTAPAETVSLAFEQIGKVSRVYVDVGDKVFAGQTLVELDSSDLYAQLAEAEANVEAEQAKLDELNKGTRPEEITVYESKVASAKVALNEAEKNLVDKSRDAYTKSDDAIRANADQLFNNPQGANPQLKFSPIDPSLQINIQNERLFLEGMLNLWSLSLSNLTADSDLNVYIGEGNKNLGNVRDFLDNLALAVNNLTSSAAISQTTVDAWRTNVSTVRTNVNTAINNLSSASEKFKTAGTSLAEAQKELDLKKAGSTPEQIAGQAATVKQAGASADVIRVKIGKNILKSPINGTVTKQDAKVGEIVSANKDVVSVISAADSKFEQTFLKRISRKLRSAIRQKLRLTLSAAALFLTRR